jgi:hypothetical protein
MEPDGLDALLGRFAAPGPLLVLCCIRLVLNDLFQQISVVIKALLCTPPRSTTQIPLASRLFSVNRAASWFVDQGWLLLSVGVLRSA